MYPELFRIGNFEITSFGVLAATGALVGVWVFGRELARSGLPSDAIAALDPQREGLREHVDGADP